MLTMYAAVYHLN